MGYFIRVKQALLHREDLTLTEAFYCTCFGLGAIVPQNLIPETPSDWLACDGRAISRYQYPELFAMIGTLYGDGDGVRTFNLPDLRGDPVSPF